MRLEEIAKIQSGFLNRGKIESRIDGSHYLIQARDVDAEQLTCFIDALVRFSPSLSRRDCILRSRDILFMSRGARNFALVLEEVPEPTLAAACFFIVRVYTQKALPEYVAWYLKQGSVQHYLRRNTGLGVHMPVVRRVVLENIEIPVPALETQERIADLDALSCREGRLLERLAAKRKELLTAVSLRASGGK